MRRADAFVRVGALVLALAIPEAASALKGIYVAVHTVRAGETVGSIIRIYRTTRGTLESLNPTVNLDQIRSGERIRILSRPGVFQKLQTGLTVSDVAQAYQIDRDVLMEANGIENPRRIRAGMELFVPDSNPLPTARAARLNRRVVKRAVRVVRGAFGKPVGTSGRLVVSDRYGLRRHPITGERGIHCGLDIVAPWGTPILAARDGVVEFSGIKGDYGKLVILRHTKEFETYYGHCTELFVREGDEVVEGQVIARVGATGGATAPHLHFEIRMDGNPRNPDPYLRRFF
jgi:lysostaphin